MQTQTGLDYDFMRPVSYPRRRRPWIYILLSIGVVCLLLGSGIGYFEAGATIAASDQQLVERALDRARSDSDRMTPLLTVPTFPNLKLDQNATTAAVEAGLARLKDAFDRDAADYEQARLNAEGDRLRLVAVSKKIEPDLGRVDVTVPSMTQVRRAVLWPRRTALEQERGRSMSAAAGYSAAETFFQIGEQQARSDSGVVDALSSFFDVEAVIIEQDNVARALSLYPSLENKIQQAVTLSQGPNQTPDDLALAQALGTTAADLKKVLQAAQARNAAGVDAALAKFNSDFNSPGWNPDNQTQYVAPETRILSPLVTRYTTALQTAGINVNAPSLFPPLPPTTTI